MRTDKMLKNLKHARLDHGYDAEMRKLLSVDLLILDDFGLDAMDSTESRDAFEILTERHRCTSIVVTSNREPVIEGESYRRRLKPKLSRKPPPGQTKSSSTH